MKPIYGEKIIVAIKINGDIEWYILDKDYCFLDYSKLERVYREKGYDIIKDDSFRYGIKVIDNKTRDVFLRSIQSCKINEEKLSQMLKRESDYNERLAYNPSIFIDFDNKELYSNYSEPESFEYFVPEGWNGNYQNFSEKIPLIKRYWIDKDGKNLIAGE